MKQPLDVAALPTHAFGRRAPLWWAFALLNCIEGTMLVLLAVSYLYLRDRMSPSPVFRMPMHVVHLGTLELALWLASAAPAQLSSYYARRGSVPGMRWTLVAATIPAVIAVVVRFEIMANLPQRWDANAYASIVWSLLAAQWLHGLTGAGENVLYIVLLARGRVEDKRRVEIDVSVVLWWFVVAGSLLVWALLFLPRLV